MRVTHPVASCLLGAALLTLGGCGGSPDRPVRAADSPATAPAPPPPPDALPTLEPPTGPPTTPSDICAEVRVDGVVVDLAPGCLVVEADTGVRWTLTGPVAADLTGRLAPGLQVVVRGRSEPVADGASLACTDTLLRAEVLEPAP